MRAAQETNGWLLRAIAIGACSLVIMMLAWFLTGLSSRVDENSGRLNSIDSHLEQLARDVQEIKNERDR